MAAGISRLRALEEAWNSRNPKQGGRHALNGFRFQLLCTLDRLVANVSHQDKALTAESLADFVEADDSVIVATEVKTSLTHGSLRHALDQLWRVYKFAGDLHSDLAPQLECRIHYYRDSTIDEKAAIARWLPDEGAADEVESFKRKVAVEKRTSILNNIAARLVNDLREKNPFERIDAWLGVLVRASDAGTFLEACESIRVELRASWNEAREVPPDFYVWTADDRPPPTVRRETEKEKQVLTGQRAHVWHLREGRFANRARYRSLHDHAETWLSTLDRGHWDNLQAMWIAGRSGSGKSVALLHLLAALHSEDPQRIMLWLGHQPGNLENAVKWALPMMEAGLDVMIAADDPYQSGTGQSIPDLLGSSLRLLQNRLQTVPELRMPAFFFCGPPEQEEAFRQETVEDLRIASYPLGIESSLEVAELQEWYFGRTGLVKLPTDEEGVLLVQLFFEWQMGEPLAPFAKRLKERLKLMMDGRESEGSVFDLVARILALRRLYVPYPIAALERAFAGNPALQSAFSTLADHDGHFEIEAERGEIRFTHPHLADAIYRTWFGGPASGPYQADHFVSGIQAWWSSASDPANRLRALWAIDGLLAAKDQPGGEVLVPRWGLIADIAKASLESVFSAQVGEIDEPCAYLPVWVRLQERLGLELKPSALALLTAAVEAQVAREALDTRGLPLACRTLIRSAPSASSPMLVAITTLLNRRIDWKYWPSIATSYGQRFGFDSLHEGARSFIEGRTSESAGLVTQVLFRRHRRPSEAERLLTIEWLRLDAARAERGSWFHAGFISEYIDVFSLDDDIRPHIETFLQECMDHRSWSFIWEKVWKGDPESRPALARSGVDWLQRDHSHSMGWEFVFERLTEDSSSHSVPLSRLLAIGRRWLVSAHPDLDPFSPVWCMLWARLGESSRRRLRSLGREWLTRVERKGWSRIWYELWTDPQSDSQALLDSAEYFLNHGMANEGWSHVWQKMRQGPHRDGGESDAFGLRFLNADMWHEGWTYVWRVMWEDRDGHSEALRKLALRFLPTCAVDAKWSGVFQRLSGDVGEHGDALWALGLAWLQSPRSAASLWPYNWKSAWQGLAGNEEEEEARRKILAGLAFAWLGRPRVPDSWPIVWNSLWDWPGGERSRLETIAEHWLVKQPPKLFKAVVGRLESPDGAPPRVYSKDYSWSDEWVRRWRATASEDQRSELSAEAMDWLDEAAANSGGWSKVWLELWTWGSEIHSQRLTALAVAWLEETDLEHPRWPPLWCRLWDEADISAREGLVGLGRRFLAEGPIGPGHVELLKRLFVHGTDRDELRDLILVRRKAGAGPKP